MENKSEKVYSTEVVDGRLIEWGKQFTRPFFDVLSIEEEISTFESGEVNQVMYEVDVNTNYISWVLGLSDSCNHVYATVKSLMNIPDNFSSYDNILNNLQSRVNSRQHNNITIIKYSDLIAFCNTKVSLIFIRARNPLQIFQDCKHIITANKCRVVYQKTGSQPLDMKLCYDFFRNLGYIDNLNITGPNGYHLASNHPDYKPVNPLDNCDQEEIFKIFKTLYENHQYEQALKCLKLLSKDNISKVREFFDKIILSDVDFHIRNQVNAHYSLVVDKIQTLACIIPSFEPPINFTNSSISMINLDNNNYRLCIRVVNYSIARDGSYNIRDSNGTVRTRNFIMDVDEYLTPITSPMEIIGYGDFKPHKSNIVGMEDMRLYDRNKFICTCCELVSIEEKTQLNSFFIPRIAWGEFDETTGNVTRFSHDRIGNISRCEKNWLPFRFPESPDVSRFIYRYEPLEICEKNINDDKSTVVFTKKFDNKLDLFCGSASPIPFHNGWLFTVHSVYYFQPRIYYHRFAWLSEDYQDLKYSQFFVFENPQIEYNLGIAKHPRGVLLSYSVLDACSRLIIVDDKVILRMLNFHQE